MDIREALRLYADYLVDTGRNAELPDNCSLVAGLRVERGYLIPDDSGHVVAGSHLEAIQQAEEPNQDGCWYDELDDFSTEDEDWDDYEDELADERNDLEDDVRDLIRTLVQPGGFGAMLYRGEFTVFRG